MKISKVTVFCKLPDCPSAESLLDYSRKRLSTGIRQSIKTHLESCDFCSAELQLLSTCPTCDAPMIPKPEMPIHLRLLAESVLLGASMLDIRVDKEQVTLSDA